MKCKAYDKDGAIFTKCNYPIVFKKEFCVKHLKFHKNTEESLKESEELYIVYGPDNKEYYFDSQNRIYDRNINLVEGYIEDNEVVIYKVSKTV